MCAVTSDAYSALFMRVLDVKRACSRCAGAGVCVELEDQVINVSPEIVTSVYNSGLDLFLFFKL